MPPLATSSSCVAALDGDALLEDDDLVAVADRREAVRDDQAGAAAGADVLVDRLLDQRVEGARRLVHDQDRRVAGERAGDLEPLALAAAPVASRPPGSARS